MANLGPLGRRPAFSKTRIGWPRFKIISRQCWIMDQDTLYKISSRCEFWSAYWGLRNQKSEILFCPVQWPWWLNKSVSLVETLAYLVHVYFSFKSSRDGRVFYSVHKYKFWKLGLHVCGHFTVWFHVRLGIEFMPSGNFQNQLTQYNFKITFNKEIN